MSAVVALIAFGVPMSRACARLGVPITEFMRWARGAGREQVDAARAEWRVRWADKLLALVDDAE